MLDREEFERLFLILYKKWEKWGKHTSAYGIGWDIWQEQQKKIDALEAENQEMLEALKAICIEVETSDESDISDYAYVKAVNLIGKVSGKTWEEIKAGKI